MCKRDIYSESFEVLNSGKTFLVLKLVFNKVFYYVIFFFRLYPVYVFVSGKKGQKYLLKLIKNSCEDFEIRNSSRFVTKSYSYSSKKFLVMFK